MMSKEKRRVPKLRFPGFTEDWEQRKLDNIAKIKTGGGTPKRLILNIGVVIYLGYNHLI